MVYPANLWPHKNHGRLLEALALVRDRELAIVLTGQHVGRLAALEGAAARLGLSGRVRHLGFVDRGSLPHLYRRAVGMVFPSLFEGFGLPPLEALACGCPVTASRASLPEVLRGHASLFDPGDPEAIAAGIEWLLTAAPPRAGEDFWRRFTWAECARVHRAAYAPRRSGLTTARSRRRKAGAPDRPREHVEPVGELASQRVRQEPPREAPWRRRTVTVSRKKRAAWRLVFDSGCSRK